MSINLPTFAGFTLFRSREELAAYFYELSQGSGEAELIHTVPVDIPAYPFFGRQILDDNLFAVDFIVIGGTDAFAMAQAIDPAVTTEDGASYVPVIRELLAAVSRLKIRSTPLRVMDSQLDSAMTQAEKALAGPASRYSVPDGEVIAWQETHDLLDLSLTAARQAFEDAQSHHLKDR